MKRGNHLCLIVWVLALLLTGSSLHAHDPFDGSTRMVVRSESIEVTVTFGTDAARLILSAAGFSQDEVSELMKPRGPRGHQTLPPSIAAKFFAIRGGDQTLSARSATLLCEGMEIIYTLIYPRPPAGVLELRAMYFGAIEGMRIGSLVAVDEDQRSLGAALLSRVSATVQVSLPEKQALK